MTAYKKENPNRLGVQRSLPKQVAFQAKYEEQDEVRQAKTEQVCAGAGGGG